MPLSEIKEISLEEIHPNPRNRRIGGFDAKRLEELAESIKSIGVQQPIIVRPSRNGDGPAAGYDLVAGERRWRASKIAGQDTVPAIVRELNDTQVLEIQTIENLQREDVHPLDECDGYYRLMEEAGYTPEDLAAKVCRSLPYIYQRLKLRSLIEPVRQMLIDGDIHISHALLVAKLPPDQQEEAREFIAQQLSFDDGVTVRMIQHHIETNILMDLHTAGFSKSDPELIAEAGPCTICQKRTGYQPVLFPELGKKDLCMDAQCFQRKLDQFFQDQREANADLKLVEIAKHWSSERNVLNKYQYKVAKKGNETEIYGIIVDGAERGKIVPIVISRTQYGSYESTPEQQKAQAELNEQKRILTERCRRTWDLIQEHIAADPDVFFENEVMLRFIVEATFERALDDSRRKLCKVRGWELKKGENEYGLGPAMNRALNNHMVKMSASELKHLLIDIVLMHDYDQGGPYGVGSGVMKRFAGLLQISVDEIDRQVRAERAAAAK